MPPQSPKTEELARIADEVRAVLLGGVLAGEDPSALENNEPPVTKSANGEERRFETPTFDPRSAFAWTLRGGEMARHEQRPHSGARPDTFAYAA